MHVYHYAPYEVTAFRRLMGRYATREDELDEMLRAGRFVDLYAVVRQGIRAGIERYSIKNLEVLYGFTRDVALKDAGRNLRRFEYALALGVIDQLPAEIRDTVAGYNRDDCVSTLRLRDWLETVRAEAIAAGHEIARPALAPGEAGPELSDRQRRVEALREKLLAGLANDGVIDVPSTSRGGSARSSVRATSFAPSMPSPPDTTASASRSSASSSVFAGTLSCTNAVPG
jgi:uncharacterized protein